MLPLLVSLLALPARAQSSECLPVPDIGCWYASEGAPADAPLLIYLRGHHPALGADVPKGKALESARQAFEFYGLGRIARANGVAVLVTYRSGIAVSDADVAALAASAKRAFSKTILAAHSGAYVGLGRTLDAGLAFSRVLMLDDFYGAGGGGLSQKLQRAVSGGASCFGFYTPHNKANYTTGYKPVVACRVDEFKSDGEHNPAVERCLGRYLDGLSCL